METKSSVNNSKFLKAVVIIFGVLVIVILIASSSNSSTPAPQAAAPSAEELRVAAEQKKAENDAFLTTPAGKLCAKYPTWRKDDCEGLINNEVWAGMTFEMITYLRGKPDHTNISNYGGNNRYQYCWTNLRPSCFYDNNNDGVLESFN
ncbi:hypothetical protein KW790_01665 [Candidatus Parcubacteria bacterium]|nr:hypothetical protein [Candidatus Parcubacteria bacterium]